LKRAFCTQRAQPFGLALLPAPWRLAPALRVAHACCAVRAQALAASPSIQRLSKSALKRRATDMMRAVRILRWKDSLIAQSGSQSLVYTGRNPAGRLILD